MRLTKPAKNLAYLSFNAARQYNFTLDLFDIMGKSLLQKTGVAKTGNNNIPLNVEQFANGLYLIVFNNHKGQTKTIKLVKQ